MSEELIMLKCACEGGEGEKGWKMGEWWTKGFNQGHNYLVGDVNYSGTLLNGHLSAVDTYNIMDNSESPYCPSIHFNT